MASFSIKPCLISNDAPAAQIPFGIVNAPDAMYARAQQQGASMVMYIKEEAHGGRGFTYAVHEGHLRSFGTYDPWQHATQEK